VTEQTAPHRWQLPWAALDRLVRPTGAGAPRSTGEFLHRSAQSYAGVGRAVVGVLGALLAPFAGPPIGVGACAAVAVCFAAWSLWYGWRTRTRPSPVACGVDVGVLCALALAQPLLVDPELTGRLAGWITPVVSFGAVAMQWHFPVRAGLLSAGAISAALVVGAALSPGIGLPGALLVGGVWTFVEALLSRLLWGLVQRGGRIADDVMDRGFGLERQAETAAARRADQRLHWSTVHDTAASTLLTIGLGEVRGDEPWLAEQVRRDIATLDGRVDEPDEWCDLDAVLAEAARRARVAVSLDLPAGPVRVPGRVGQAVEGAVGEALENVRRHAGTGRAEVRLAGTAERVEVAVRDRGTGFTPAAVPPTRHGLGLSIRERMARVGGAATVSSAPGEGTVVTLEWSRG
jgi:signal transduction histidine kinase